MSLLAINSDIVERMCSSVFLAWNTPDVSHVKEPASHFQPRHPEEAQAGVRTLLVRGADSGEGCD